jgi:glycosyltransferase involved in cell wall biosynthesis
MRLMVIISEPISEWIKKGEIVDRYYNPGDLFDEVHLVLCNSDSPDLQITQRLVGRASLTIKNFDLTKRQRITTLGLQPELLYFWAKPLLEYAKLVQPDLVRCHGATQNALAALKIKKELAVPYVVSLHTNPDLNIRGRPGSFAESMYHRLTIRIERKTLRFADLVMPVYEPIVPYLKRLKVNRYKVHYNVLNSSLRIKSDYVVAKPARLIYVGRLYDQKNPEQILRALQGLPHVLLTIVGDGNLRESLENDADELGIRSRVTFIPALLNDELCDLLYASDIFVVHTDAWEISKSVLEALLTGLPIVINERKGDPIPELNDSIVKYVKNNPESYRTAILELLHDDTEREKIGMAAALVSNELWSPAKCEAAIVATYSEILKNYK